ncbi:HAD family hydrolase [Pontibacter rugosus]|uniref:phosphoglycolate phosphatase n=1 Tax=Pontibacter rugosus TaxID=1745966 RepID=A0ABW3SLN6_9BACT
MNNTRNYDGLIFDLDGTLWDSTQTIADAWNAAASKFDFMDTGIHRDDIRRTAGMPYDAIYDKLFPSLNNEQREQLRAESGKLELAYLQKQGGILYPELEQTLKQLQTKYKLYIVSNCQSGYIEIFLKYNKLESYFTDIACFGDKRLPKGENIKQLVERNKLQQPVYIGDTQGDYDASVKAGTPFILAAYGFGEVDTEVESINSFAELQELI